MRSPYFYSQEYDDNARDDDFLFDKISGLGEKFNEEFLELMILLIRQLFEEKIVENKVGKNIPIILHELEYYDKPISWTLRANPTDLTRDFMQEWGERFRN